jgi:hypothetical protein
MAYLAVSDDKVKEGGKFEISSGGGNYRTSAPKRILPKDGNYRTSAPKVLKIHDVSQIRWCRGVGVWGCPTDFSGIKKSMRILTVSSNSSMKLRPK